MFVPGKLFQPSLTKTSLVRKFDKKMFVILDQTALFNILLQLSLSVAEITEFLIKCGHQFQCQ